MTTPSTDQQSAQLRDNYCAARDAVSGSISLSDLALLQRAASAYASTAEGQALMREDLTTCNSVIAGILQEALESSSGDENKDHRTPRGYILTPHLVKQAKMKGFSLQDLIDVVDAPATVYESRRYPGQVKHIRGGLCVAVDPAAKRAITVFVDQEFTERRADQTDADALAYERKRKNSPKKSSRT